MRRILTRAAVAAVAAAALWAAWWPVAAWHETRATEAWLEARRDEGWQADWADVAVSGFPLAYERRIADPALADPVTGWAWRAEGLRLARARHPRLSGAGVTISLPPEQVVQTPRQKIDLTAVTMTARVVLAGPADRLARAEATLEGIAATSGAGWETTLAAGRLTARPEAEVPDRVAFTLSAEGLAPPAAAVRAASEADVAPAAIERLRAEATVTFDRPWGLAALEEARPQPRRIDLDEAALRWGRLELRVAGRRDVDAGGTPEGELLVKATNWREILAAARASGAVPESLAGAVESALELASRLAGSPQTLDIPLRFANGRTRLGPVPIGAAPVLRLP